MSGFEFDDAFGADAEEALSQQADIAVRMSDLSPDQRQVFDAMMDWTSGRHRAAPKPPADFAAVEFDLVDDDLPSAHSGPNRDLSGILRVGGYAGTGKSTILGVFAAAARRKKLTAYICFTGRASSILARKLKANGVNTTNMTLGEKDSLYSYTEESPMVTQPFCGTIHRLIYRPVIDDKTEELKGWKKREELDRDYDLIVIDEASMVGDEMLTDLQRFGVPIMAVGDHGQLAPVRDRGDLMQNPDLRLEKIHRQAESNPVIQFSRVIRETGRLDRKLADGDHIIIGRKTNDAEVLRRAYEQAKDVLDVGLLCWRNASRIRLNGVARVARKYRGAPSTGDLVVCLKNEPPVYNGMRGVLLQDSEPSQSKPWLLHAKIAFPEEELSGRTYMLCAPQFMREKTFATIEELHQRGVRVEKMREAGSLFDFGYALTVHKSQGSQFAHAIVYVDRPEEPHSEDWRRWAYTAVTRASRRLTLLL